MYVFALVPPIALSFFAALFGKDQVIGGDGITLLLVGLAVIVAAGDLIPLRRQHLLRSVWLVIMAAPAVVVLGITFVQPWIGGTEVRTSLPARDIGHFFGETSSGAPAVVGVGGGRSADRDVDRFRSSIASARDVRCDVATDAWLTPALFNETGGVVVWRAADTAGTPPADIAQRFPGLVPEVPRAFEHTVRGRQNLVRIGWSIVRPQPTVQGPR